MKDKTSFFGVDILYEDNHLMIVDKPAGMLSQGSLSSDLDVLTLAKTFIKKRDDKPGNVYMGLVHRLDRKVAGVMILAKTSKAASRISDQIRKRKIKKNYLALVSGCPSPPQETLENHLIKNRSLRMSNAVDSDWGGKKARLEYQVIKSNQKISLIKVRLFTGFFHQIRCQLAHINHPVIGDKKYGSKLFFENGKIALIASSLEFAHPVKNTAVKVITKKTLRLNQI